MATEPTAAYGRRRPRPPRKSCGECGRVFYGWGDFCGRAECMAARMAPQEESLRAFRRRVIETALEPEDVRR